MHVERIPTPADRRPRPRRRMTFLDRCMSNAYLLRRIAARGSSAAPSECDRSTATRTRTSGQRCIRAASPSEGPTPPVSRSTGAVRAATIRPCRCGVVRTARHPRPKQHDAGSATVRAPPADPAVTSGAPLPVSSGSVAWTASDDPFAVTRSGHAGRLPTRRASTSRRFRGSDRSGPSAPTIRERPFDRSSSSRSSPARRPRTCRIR